MNEILTNYRQKIDDYDKKIIQLLKDRLQVVKQVAAYKHEHFPNQYAIRAGREATMIRNIAKTFEGSDFSPAAACQIWRTIIGTSTAAESTMTVSVYAPEGQSDLFWLTREYFGPSAIITRQPHIKRVISEVVDKKSAIGVIPTFSLGNEVNDWQHLLYSAEHAPKIFAHLPFVYTRENPKQFPSGLAFARVIPEASGEDVSLYALEVEHDTSQHRLQTLLGEHGINATWLAAATPTSDCRQHLIELSGFIAPDCEEMKSFTQSLGHALKHIYYLGGYALPFTLHEEL